jgi:prepilin-type N-terminal cleavage/methylation domain-containing protein/prepilin-type processing-associated H-X9-DG protein
VGHACDARPRNSIPAKLPRTARNISPFRNSFPHDAPRPAPTVRTVMHRFPHTQRTRAAFTLTELLTVIAIIGVLAAIIIPSVGAVRTAANRTASASNLRQWGVALLLYLPESRGRLPYEVTAGSADTPTWAQVDNPTYDTCWFNALPPYVSQPSLSATPAADRDRSNRTPAYASRGSILYAPGAPVEDYRKSLANAIKPTFCYMMNSQIYNNSGPAGVKDDPRGVLLSAFPENAKLSRIAFMTECVLDVAAEQAPGGGDYNLNRAKGDGLSVCARYNKRTNVSFLDGSVRTYDSAYLVKQLGGTYSRADKPDVAWSVWTYPW